MKIELEYTMWEGCWQECALCGEGFRAYEVEAHTTLPGEYCVRAVCRHCVLAGEQGLNHRLSVRVWELRDLADRLEQACEERIEVPSPRRAPPPQPGAETSGQGAHEISRVQVNPRANDKRGKRARVTQRGLLA
jgi:hypothetical protein